MLGMAVYLKPLLSNIFPHVLFEEGISLIDNPVAHNSQYALFQSMLNALLNARTVQSPVCNLRGFGLKYLYAIEKA